MKKLSAIGIILTAIFVIATAANAGSQTITIIERPGYFETHGNVFDIPAGKYKFIVKNMSGKDAGFVFNKGQNNVTTNNSSMKVILIKNGEQGSFTVNLTKGNYTYFCPIIPTPPYPLRVK
ncbi:MAG: cupredoxin domain-containing protein [Desulfobacterales bacterium]|nr:cupredoxin domain-containing protein [Desulfobacterales bacterium]